MSMPLRNTNISLAMLIMAIVALLLIILMEGVAVISGPTMTFAGPNYEIDYYRAMANGPTLIIHGDVNGLPVPITVTLYAYTPTKIYPLGYYWGLGSVSIHLGRYLIREISDKWLFYYWGFVWSSIIAFVTYENGETIRTTVIAIPYNPTWITKLKPMVIDVYANLGVDSLITRVTMGNAVKGTTHHYAWLLKQYHIFTNGVPLIFVGWSVNALKQLNDIVVFTGTDVENGEILSILSNGSNVISIGPTYFLHGDFFLGPTPIVDVNYNTTLFENTTFTAFPIVLYSVPSQGLAYIGISSYMADTAFQLYEVSSLGNSRLNAWINGTLSLAPIPNYHGYGNGIPYIIENNAYLDLGNGSLTQMLNEVLSSKGRIPLISSYHYGEGWGFINNCTRISSRIILLFTSRNFTAVNYILPLQIPYMSIPNYVVNISSLIYSLILGTYSNFITGMFYNPDYYVVKPMNDDFVSVVAYGSDNMNALIKVIFTPSTSTNLYITVVGNPLPIPSARLAFTYPIGIIINESNYYAGNECIR